MKINVTLDDADRIIVALEHKAAYLLRNTRSRDNAGPALAAFRAAFRDEAREMKLLAEHIRTAYLLRDEHIEIPARDNSTGKNDRKRGNS